LINSLDKFRRGIRQEALLDILNRFSLKDRAALIRAKAGAQFGSNLTEGLAEAGVAARNLAVNEAYAET